MSSNMNSMNTALLTSIITATLLGFASLASGRPFDAADFTAIAFTTGLVAWTVAQYNRTPRSLYAARPIRLPAPMGARPASLRAAA
jgi:energy-converting hydrogenase Eha subunit A